MFALVYWVGSQESDVVPLSHLPQKLKEENAEGLLKWKHAKSGATGRYKVRIVKIAERRLDLDKVSIDKETGKIIESTQKAFTVEAIKNKQHLTLVSKETQKAQKASKRIINEGIMAMDSIFEAERPSTSSAVASTSDVMMGSDVKTTPQNMLLRRASKEVIYYLESVLQLAKATLKEGESYDQHAASTREDVQMLNSIKFDGLGKVEIFPNSRWYLPESRMCAIMLRADEDPENWSKLAKAILEEVYGNDLAIYSAKGTRGSQGIYVPLYNAIYGLVQQRLNRTGKSVNETEFNKTINKFCSNKRSSLKRPDSNTECKKSKREKSAVTEKQNRNDDATRQEDVATKHDVGPPTDQDVAQPSQQQGVGPPTDQDVAQPPQQQDVGPPTDQDVAQPSQQRDVGPAPLTEHDTRSKKVTPKKFQTISPRRSPRFRDEHPNRPQTAGVAKALFVSPTRACSSSDFLSEPGQYRHPNPYNHHYLPPNPYHHHSLANVYQNQYYPPDQQNFSPNPHFYPPAQQPLQGPSNATFVGPPDFILPHYPELQGSHILDLDENAKSLSK